MRAPPGQTLDGAGPSLLAFKRCPVVEPGQCRLGHHGVALFGHVGNEAPRRQTIEVDQVADAVGHHLESCMVSTPPLEWPIQGIA